MRARKIVSLFLCFLLMTVFMPMTVFAEGEVLTGALGEHILYSLNINTNELTLSSVEGATEPDSFNIEQALKTEQKLWKKIYEITKIVLSENFDATKGVMPLFMNAYSLQEIQVSEGNDKYALEDGALFSKDKTILYFYPGRRSGTNYSIPSTVIQIGTDEVSPFETVSYLETIEIPASVTDINAHSFNGQIGDGNRISSFIVDENNLKYKDIDGVLFSKDGKELIAYPNNKNDKEYVIPDSVESINAFAFSRSWNLEKISIPESVKTINEQAFSCTWKLNEVTIPASVTIIKKDAFRFWGNVPLYKNGTVNFMQGTQLSSFPEIAFSSGGEVTVNIPCNLNWNLEDVADNFIFNQTHSFTEYAYNNDAKVGVDGTETAVCDNGCGATDTRTKNGTALSGGGSFGGGGGFIPSITVQKPTISTGDGYTVSTGSDGTTATIDVQDGYELVDVTVNGVSKGEVTTLTGLKTGDKVEVKVVKKEDFSEVEKVQAALATVTADNFKARSKQVTLKRGKEAIKVTWDNTSDIELDGVEVFRSVKRYSGYGKKPVFSTAKNAYYNTAITKGTKYYYKVRGYVEIDGIKYYTDWSAKAWRTVK